MLSNPFSIKKILLLLLVLVNSIVYSTFGSAVEVVPEYTQELPSADSVEKPPDINKFHDKSVNP